MWKETTADQWKGHEGVAWGLASVTDRTTACIPSSVEKRVADIFPTKRVIALVGRSGSGKSTVAKFLHRVAGTDTIHARSALRPAISQEEWARRSRRASLVSGVDAAVFSKIASSQVRDIVLDGYPRTTEQLNLLHTAAREHNWTIQLLYLDMPGRSGQVRSVARQLLRDVPSGDSPMRAFWKLARDAKTIPQILDAASRLDIAVSVVDAITPKNTVEQQVRSRLGFDLESLGWDRRILQLVATFAPDGWITGGGHNYRPFFNNVFGAPSESWDVDLRVPDEHRAAHAQKMLAESAPELRWHVKNARSWARTELGQDVATVEETLGMNALICLCTGIRWVSGRVEVYFAHPEAERDLWRGILRPNPDGQLAFSQAKARSILAQYPAVTAVCWDHKPKKIALTFQEAMREVRTLEHISADRTIDLSPVERATAETIRQLFESLPQMSQPVPWPPPASLPECDPWNSPDASFRAWVTNQTRSRNPVDGRNLYLQNALKLQSGTMQKPTHQGWDLRTHAIRSLLELETDHLPVYRRLLRLAMLWHDIGKLWNITNPGCHGALGARRWQALQGSRLPGITPEDETLVSHFIACHDLLGRLSRTINDPAYPGGLSPARVRTALYTSLVDARVMLQIAKALWRADIGSIPLLRWLLPLADPLANLVALDLAGHHAN